MKSLFFRKTLICASLFALLSAGATAAEESDVEAGAQP